ncbi:MFS transporter [Paenibacillus sp. N1-5-1-14]|uniref:MFS transporter n=1 Tax=Paenibacillus radicibacter TaxID=2972488 RepID=UPI002158DD56|nr:MFS transporter [Paenibacillus radicibacter]MCR8643245.1 MFS transporter [Paenibacillus radicibacter]
MKAAFTRDLIILYIARFVSTFGDWIYFIALTVILAKSGGTAIAFMSIAKIAGIFIGKFIAGSIADRVGHKLTIIVSDVLRAGLFFLMPFCLDSPILFLLVGASSILSSFFSAAYSPMITMLTTNENRLRVNSIREVISSISILLGPLLGGVLVLKDTYLPFFLDGISFLISALCFLCMRVPMAAHSDEQSLALGETGSSKWQILCSDLKFSFQYIKTNRALLGITAATTILSVSGIMEVYEVLFITDTLGLDSSSYSMIIALNGGAVLLAGILQTVWISRYMPTYVYPISMTLHILLSLIYALSGNFIMLAISSVLMNMALMAVHTASDTICQTEIPVAVQGRVMSVQGIVPELVSSISIAFVGFLLTQTSLRVIFVSIAVLSFLCIPLSLSVLRKNKLQTPEPIINSPHSH